MNLFWQEIERRKLFDPQKVQDQLTFALGEPITKMTMAYGRGRKEKEHGSRNEVEEDGEGYG
jgi:hypothetical protein